METKEESFWGQENKERVMTVVSVMAKDIREKIKGGRLYGIDVDMENEDMVLVAAYFYHLVKE